MKNNQEKTASLNEVKRKLLDNVIRMSDQQLDRFEELVRGEDLTKEGLEKTLKLIEAVRAWKEGKNDLYPSQAAG